MAPQVLAGKYIIEGEIARGGMGVIYKARDRTLNRIVAIKLVHAHLSDDPSFAERFLREARSMARLQHENVATIYAVENDQKKQFLVMEFCSGSNLRAILRNQPHLPVHNVVDISRQLALALAYAHAQGVIHRDIKPANVIVDKTGKVKLTDFGIAAALDEVSLTSTGQIVGTLEYMSPEQARNLKLDGRSDLYSLGIVMYEMLTGRTPYAQSSGTSILGTLVYDRTELELPFSNHVPSRVQGVVRALLRRNPDERMPDAETLANQLHKILNELPQAPPTKTPDGSELTIVLAPPPSKPEAKTHVLPPSEETVISPSRSTDDQERSLAAQRPSSQTAHPGLSRPPETKKPVPAPPHVPPKDKEPDQTFPPPRAFPIKPLIVWGILIVAVVGLFLSQGSPPEISTSDGKPTVSPVDNSVSPPLPPFSPDPQLRLLLDNFEQAYERRDMGTLRSVSRMDDARLRNIEMMFRNYATLKLSIARITLQEHDAVAVLVIDTAITTDGQSVDLSPIAKEIRLRIPRQGQDWGKIEW